MKSAADLKYDKSQKIAAMKKILDTADDEDRALTAAEDGTYKTLDKDIDGASTDRSCPSRPTVAGEPRSTT